jgi:uncharacterized membrane protein
LENQLYTALEKKNRRAILIIVWVLIAICFIALQFYAVLLGGVFNVVRLTQTHFLIETVALSLGYFLAGGHALLHLIRGVVFRITGNPTWPF